MRVLIAGQGWLAAELLNHVLQSGYEVVAVTAPSHKDRLTIAAQTQGIEWFTHDKKLSQVPQVDIILCAHLHAFMSDSARRMAKIGVLGYHPSLLPRHRGKDAIRWAIHMGEAITGGTVYWLDDGIDTGDIAAQEFCHVYRHDDPSTLWRRALAPMGIKLFMQVLSQLQRGEMPRAKQDEVLATYEPPYPQRV